MKPDHLPLLKEVYEKGKVKKLATDGQNDMNDNQRGKLPPFMKGRQNPADAQKRQIGSDAAKRRLQAMQTKKKPEGK